MVKQKNLNKNYNMKKLLFVLSITLLYACSSENNGSNSNPTNTLKLSSITETEYGNSETINFTYSGNTATGFNEIDDVSTYSFIFGYSNNNLSSITSYHNNIVGSVSTFIYSNGKITNRLSEEDNIEFNHVYTYNSSSQMTNEKQYSNGNLDNSQDYEYNIEGNISKHLYGSSNYRTFEYDTKKNPYSLIYSEAVMKTYGVGYSKNNIIKETTNSGTVTIYEYQYNENGYPTSVIGKINGTTVITKTFVYN